MHGKSSALFTGQFVPTTIAGVKTLKELFDCWDTIAQMASDVGESHWTVIKWRKRKSIPSSAWPALIKALKRKGKDIGAAELLAMHTKSARSKSSPVRQPYNGGNAA